MELAWEVPLGIRDPGVGPRVWAPAGLSPLDRSADAWELGQAGGGALGGEVWIERASNDGRVQRGGVVLERG